MVKSGSDTKNLPQHITYSDANSAVLTSVSPRYGNYKGGETVTFTGTGFPTVSADVEVLIDTYACTILSASATSI